MLGRLIASAAKPINLSERVSSISHLSPSSSLLQGSEIAASPTKEPSGRPQEPLGAKSLIHQDEAAPSNGWQPQAQSSEGIHQNTVHFQHKRPMPSDISVAFSNTPVCVLTTICERLCCRYHNILGCHVDLAHPTIWSLSMLGSPITRSLLGFMKGTSMRCWHLLHPAIPCIGWSHTAVDSKSFHCSWPSNKAIEHQCNLMGIATGVRMLAAQEMSVCWLRSTFIALLYSTSCLEPICCAGLT